MSMVALRTTRNQSRAGHKSSLIRIPRLDSTSGHALNRYCILRRYRDDEIALCRARTLVTYLQVNSGIEGLDTQEAINALPTCHSHVLVPGHLIRRVVRNGTCAPDLPRSLRNCPLQPLFRHGRSTGIEPAVLRIHGQQHWTRTIQLGGARVE